MPIRIDPRVRNLLAIWGALSLILLAVVMSAAAYYYTTATRTRDGDASKDDVRFVLNWPGLGEERIEAVVNSHDSGAHITGDHFTAYAIRVTRLTESELTGDRWVRGDRADPLMAEAIRFVTEAGHEAPWLPAADEFLTDQYYVWRWRVEVGERVSAADLIFARPSDRMIFYVSLQV
jgi:hypothetical protein